MVSFQNMGRMGNFLFQAATAYAYAQDHGLEFTVPSRTNDRYWNPLYLQHLARPLPAKKNMILLESGHAFSEIPYMEHWHDRNIILKGYWQSEKYFAKYRSDILEMFGAPLVNRYGWAAIHIRLGDYLLYPDKHPVTPSLFYASAIDFLSTKFGIRNFRVFSDEPMKAERIILPVVREVSSFNPYPINLDFVSGNSETKDLMLIAECEHQINSSSTFSWWGAWLNPNKDKIVITPKLWFVPGHGGLDTSDIIPSQWIKM